MGSVLIASCPCGYSSEELAVGGGMADFQTFCGAPALCETCRAVVVVNYLDERPTCAGCKGPATFYDAPTLRSQAGPDNESALVFSWRVNDQALKLPDSEYRCPRCREVKMRFFDAGIEWD